MNIIVSLTTTYSRLSLLFYTLQSLRRQRYQDFRIVINLSKEPYLIDAGINEVPDWMVGEDVSIRFVKNSGPYRKLIPLINEINDSDIIVTADDDVLYGEDWLGKMVERAELYPDTIVCGRARLIKKNVFGRHQNYANWPAILTQQIDEEILPIGCAGVAYRKALLDLVFLNDESNLELSPTSDDLWFKLASFMNGTKVYVDPDIESGCVYLQHSMGLQEINLYRNNVEWSFFRRVGQKLVKIIKDYLGISLAKNDFSWRRSSSYAQKKGDKL